MLDRSNYCGAHFGAQTRITCRHSRCAAVLRICGNTFFRVTLSCVGSQSPLVENPRVGGSTEARAADRRQRRPKGERSESIPPLGTAVLSALQTAIPAYERTRL